MLNFISAFIIDYCNGIDDIIVDFTENYVNKKLSIGLTIRNQIMASIEVLPDYTFDFLALDIESEKVLYIGTEYYDSTDDLKNGILNFILKV